LFVVAGSIARIPCTNETLAIRLVSGKYVYSIDKRDVLATVNKLEVTCEECIELVDGFSFTNDVWVNTPKNYDEFDVVHVKKELDYLVFRTIDSHNFGKRLNFAISSFDRGLSEADSINDIIVLISTVAGELEYTNEYIKDIDTAARIARAVAIYVMKVVFTHPIVAVTGDAYINPGNYSIMCLLSYIEEALLRTGTRWGCSKSIRDCFYLYNMYTLDKLGIPPQLKHNFIKFNESTEAKITTAIKALTKYMNK